MLIAEISGSSVMTVQVVEAEQQFAVFQTPAAAIRTTSPPTRARHAFVPFTIPLLPPSRERGRKPLLPRSPFPTLSVEDAPDLYKPPHARLDGQRSVSTHSSQSGRRAML